MVLVMPQATSIHRADRAQHEPSFVSKPCPMWSRRLGRVTSQSANDRDPGASG
jgi:hypothetical protein